MSESSEDRTKRQYLSLLNNNEWNYQYSVFYEDAEQSKSLLEDMIEFKQTIRRKYPTNPLLIRIQLHKKEELQAYLSIMTTEKMKNLSEITAKAFPSEVKILYRRLTEERISRIASAIKTQKPHNLERFFNKPARRWSLLNKPHLKEKQYDQANQ